MNFSPQSRVWLYVSSREFTLPETTELNDLLNQFCIQWAAHGKDLYAKGEVLHQQFILLMVDETHAGASGCSIDTSVHFIQSLERKYNIQLFNRMLVAIKDGEEVKVIDSLAAKKQIEEGILNENSLVFNSLIQTKAEFDTRFIIPLNESWLAKYLKTVKA